MNLIKPAIIGTLTAALAVFAINGFAGETGETVEGEAPESEAMDKPAFDELDANIDGVITLDEAQETWLAAVFQDVDQDKDGVINRSEYDTAAS
jgi:Ca2+-binding EF-hand superfamily protein